MMGSDYSYYKKRKKKYTRNILIKLSIVIIELAANYLFDHGADDFE